MNLALAFEKIDNLAHATTIILEAKNLASPDMLPSLYSDQCVTPPPAAVLSYYQSILIEPPHMPLPPTPPIEIPRRKDSLETLYEPERTNTVDQVFSPIKEEMETVDITQLCPDLENVFESQRFSVVLGPNAAPKNESRARVTSCFLPGDLSLKRLSNVTRKTPISPASSLNASSLTTIDDQEDLLFDVNQARCSLSSKSGSDVSSLGYDLNSNSGSENSGQVMYSRSSSYLVSPQLSPSSETSGNRSFMDDFSKPKKTVKEKKRVRIQTPAETSKARFSIVALVGRLSLSRRRDSDGI